MIDASDFRPLSTDEKRRIEKEINEKLKGVGRLRDFFGSGHGVDIVGMMNSWIDREIAPYEERLGIKLGYTVKTMPDGTYRIILTDTGDHVNR